MRTLITIIVLLIVSKGWSSSQGHHLIAQKQQEIEQKKQQIKNFKQAIRNFVREEDQLQAANSRFVNQRLLLHEMFTIAISNGDSLNGLVLFVADQRFDYEDLSRRLIESGDYVDKSISQEHLKSLIIDHFLELDRLPDDASHDKVEEFIIYSLKMQKEITKEIANIQYFISLNKQDQQALMERAQRQIIKNQSDIEAIRKQNIRNSKLRPQDDPHWWDSRGLLVP